MGPSTWAFSTILYQSLLLFAKISSLSHFLQRLFIRALKMGVKIEQLLEFFQKRDQFLFNLSADNKMSSSGERWDTQTYIHGRRRWWNPIVLQLLKIKKKADLKYRSIDQICSS